MYKYKKKILLVTLIFTLFIPPVFSQEDDLGSLNKGLGKLFHELGTTMGHNLLLSSSINSYHIGNFPHFSLESAIAATISVDLLEDPKSYFTREIEGSDRISQFANLVPGVGATMPFSIRVGGGGIPFDVGFHILYVPLDLIPLPWSAQIGSTLTIGFDTRFVILEEQIVQPGISIGFKYMYQGFSASLNLDSLKLSGINRFNNNEPIEVSISKGQIKLNLDSHVIGFPIQLSKTLRFFEPFITIEPYMNIVDSGFTSTGTVQLTSGSTNIKLHELYPNIFQDNSTFMLASSEITGGIRFATGAGFIINRIWHLELQGSYEVITNSFGVLLNGRLTF